MKIDPESFEEWAAHPITEAMFKVYDAGIKQAGEAWIKASLVGGVSDPIELAKVRARIAVFEELKGMSAEKMEEILNG